MSAPDTTYRARCYTFGCPWVGYRTGFSEGRRPIDRTHPKPCPVCGKPEVRGLSPKVFAMTRSSLRHTIDDEMYRRFLTQFSCHDEPMRGSWMCGRCPYANVGQICTKCGAPRYEGRERRDSGG